MRALLPDFRIFLGLDLLLKQDSYLLKNDINERSITHKLGEHFQRLFSEWNVDCEFNKNLDRPKDIIIDPKEFLHKMANFLESHYGDDKAINLELNTDFSREELINFERQLRNEENVLYDEELDLLIYVIKLTNGKIITKTIYPDVIVHNRGTKNNYIVIEAKKSTNQNRESRLYDLLKLLVLVSSKEYGYKQGIFIDLPAGNDLSKHTVFSYDPMKLDSRVFKIISK